MSLPRAHHQKMQLFTGRQAVKVSGILMDFHRSIPRPAKIDDN